MVKTTIENPYSPPSVIIARANDSFWAGNLRCLVWFIPGTIVGMHVGRYFQSIAEGTLRAIPSMTVYSAAYLLMFACCCFLSTLFWRLPRRYFVGGGRVNPVAAFISGILMPLLATLAIRTGVNLGWLPMKQWAHNGILVLSGFVAVECESILAGSLGKRG